MIKYRSIITQLAYVLVGCTAIWSMIDSPFDLGGIDRATGYIIANAIVIVWSLFMFASGFIVLAKNVYNQTTSEHSIPLRVFMIMRMVLAILFGIGTQWFFFQAMHDYFN